MEFQAVLDAVRSLPLDDQFRLVGQIQDDLRARPKKLNLTPEQIAEFDRRLAAFDAKPIIGISWQESEGRIDKRLAELGE